MDVELIADVFGCLLAAVEEDMSFAGLAVAALSWYVRITDVSHAVAECATDKLMLVKLHELTSQTRNRCVQ